MNIRFYYDKQGIPCVETDAAHRLIERYLNHDVQISPQSAQKILERVSVIETDKEDQIKVIGNGFRLLLTKKYAKIESLYDEAEGLELPLDDFKGIMNKWLELISKK